MNRQDSFSDLDEGFINSTTPVEDIIRALAKRGCADLTPQIDPDTCGQNPHAFGGFCDVYRGKLNDGTCIAIKSLRVCDGPEADEQKRKLIKHAARELYLWSKLQHPNIIPLMGLTMFRGRIAMISEWMDNGSLMSFVRMKPDTDRISLCMDVCAGLRHIHAHGMVHGDLKAANVMISAHGVAMIADFGNTQIKDLTLKFSNTSKFNITVRWTAPELLRDEGNSQPTKEADVYAYGMTLLEILTGEIPFPEKKKEVEVMFLVLVQQKRPSRPKVELADEMWELISSCWAWGPAERPSMENIGDRLRALHPDYKYRLEELGPRSSDIQGRAEEPQSLKEASMQLDELTRTDKAMEHHVQVVGHTPVLVEPANIPPWNGAEAQHAQLARQVGGGTKNDASKPGASGSKRMTKGTRRSAEEIEEDKGSKKKRRKPPGVGRTAREGTGGGWLRNVSIHRERSLSPAMADLIGVQRLPYPHAVLRLWGYIKANSLHNPEDGEEILCDEPMKRVFGVDRFNMLQINDLVGEHVFDKSK